MSPGARSQGDDQAGAELESYGRFLAHQLGELGVLLGAGSTSALDGARARVERMASDLRDLYVPLGDLATCDLGDESRAAASELSTPELPVAVAGPASPPAVAADPALLRALFRHLMRTALAQARRSVSFSLEAEAAEGGRVAVRLEDDAGPVDAAQALARLQIADGSSGSGVVLGAGVSGPAAARIVALHGGRIAIEAGDRGAVVTFDLPGAAA